VIATTNASCAVEVLMAVAEAHEPVRVAEEAARLGALDLFVAIGDVQVMQSSAAALFVSEVTAS
jgi:hypothetical protein